jgi:hypothetical protein
MTTLGKPTHFVVQMHTKPDGIHWDFMLEKDAILATWRVELPPNQWSSPKTNPLYLTKIADHDPKFLTYQGPVNNKTGTVKIAEKGKFYVEKWNENTITGRLEGDILNAEFNLQKNHNDQWQLKLQPPKSKTF